MGDNRDALMTTDIEGELDYNIGVALEKLEANAVAVDRAKAKQHIKSYKDKQVRSQARHQAHLRRFREASKVIQRTKRGWSALSDRELAAMNPVELQQARKARNQTEHRAKAAPLAAPAPAIASVVITREAFDDRVARLLVWLALPGPRQRHLRRREADIMRAWVLYQDHVARHGRRPSLAQFAETFTARFDQPMTRQMAQKRLGLLDTLMAAGGPLR